MLRASKTTALITAFTFAFTSISWSAPLPPSVNLQGTQIRTQDGVQLSSVAQIIDIPESAGSIRSRYVPKVSAASRLEPLAPVIVHIEDAHSNYEAQVHIKKILEHLTKNYDLDLIFLEGAMEKINPELLRFFKDESRNQALADMLARDGIVGGTELFLLEHGREAKAKGISAYGVENPELYRENLKAFRDAYGGKEVADRFLKRLKSEILTKSSYIFNRKLNTFFKEWLFYQDVQTGLLSHLKTLAKFAKAELKLDMTDAREQVDWPQLVRMFKLEELESELDQKGIDEEKEKLTRWIAEHKIDEEYVKGIRQILDPRSQGAAKDPEPRHVIERFYDGASRRGFSFQDYPALSKYLGIEILKSEINAADLFDEVHRITEHLLNRLAVTGEEKALISIYQDYFLLAKTFSLELVREDYTLIKERRHEVEPSSLLERLKKIRAKGAKPILKRGRVPFGSPLSHPLGVPGGSMTDQARSAEDLQHLFQKALSFYDGAEAREKVILEKMIAKMKELGKRNAILVTGGFHSEGFAAQFKNRAISYVDIAPRISELTDSKSYLDVMTLKGNYLIKSSYSNHPTIIDGSGLPNLVKYLGGDVSRYYEGRLNRVLGSVTDRRRFSRDIIEINESPAGQSHKGNGRSLYTRIGNKLFWAMTVDGRYVEVPPGLLGISPDGPAVVPPQIIPHALSRAPRININSNRINGTPSGVTTSATLRGEPPTSSASRSEARDERIAAALSGLEMVAGVVANDLEGMDSSVESLGTQAKEAASLIRSGGLQGAIDIVRRLASIEITNPRIDHFPEIFRAALNNLENPGPEPGRQGARSEVRADHQEVLDSLYEQIRAELEALGWKSEGLKGGLQTVFSGNIGIGMSDPGYLNPYYSINRREPSRIIFYAEQGLDGKYRERIRQRGTSRPESQISFGLSETKIDDFNPFREPSVLTYTYSGTPPIVGFAPPQLGLRTGGIILKPEFFQTHEADTDRDPTTPKLNISPFPLISSDNTELLDKLIVLRPTRSEVRERRELSHKRESAYRRIPSEDRWWILSGVISKKEQARLIKGSAYDQALEILSQVRLKELDRAQTLGQLLGLTKELRLRRGTAEKWLEKVIPEPGAPSAKLSFGDIKSWILDLRWFPNEIILVRAPTVAGKNVTVALETRWVGGSLQGQRFTLTITAALSATAEDVVRAVLAKRGLRKSFPRAFVAFTQLARARAPRLLPPTSRSEVRSHFQRTEANRKLFKILPLSQGGVQSDGKLLFEDLLREQIRPADRSRAGSSPAPSSSGSAPDHFQPERGFGLPPGSPIQFQSGQAGILKILSRAPNFSQSILVLSFSYLLYLLQKPIDVTLPITPQISIGKFQSVVISLHEEGGLVNPPAWGILILVGIAVSRIISNYGNPLMAPEKFDLYGETDHLPPDSRVRVPSPDIVAEGSYINNRLPQGFSHVGTITKGPMAVKQSARSEVRVSKEEIAFKWDGFAKHLAGLSPINSMAAVMQSSSGAKQRSELRQPSDSEPSKSVEDLNARLGADRIEIVGETPEEFLEILTPEHLKFVAHIHRTFGNRREELLKRRQTKQRLVNFKLLINGIFYLLNFKPPFHPLDYMKGNDILRDEQGRDIRETDYTVFKSPDDIPSDLKKRRVDVTGPLRSQRMALYRANAVDEDGEPLDVDFSDLEDAHWPGWVGTLTGLKILRDRVHGTLEGLSKNPATLVVRPRGWHLPEKHIKIDGEYISGGLFDFAMFVSLNKDVFRTNIERDKANGTNNGSGIYPYIAKVEDHREVKLWDDVFTETEKQLGFDHGSIKASVLIETIWAMFQLDEIIYQLKDHIVLIDFGRWDYLFSFIKVLGGWFAYLLPDRVKVAMQTHMMTSGAKQVVKIAHKRNIHAGGGMSNFIPIASAIPKNGFQMAGIDAQAAEAIVQSFLKSFVLVRVFPAPLLEISAVAASSIPDVRPTYRMEDRYFYFGKHSRWITLSRLDPEVWPLVDHIITVLENRNTPIQTSDFEIPKIDVQTSEEIFAALLARGFLVLDPKKKDVGNVNQDKFTDHTTWADLGLSEAFRAYSGQILDVLRYSVQRRQENENAIETVRKDKEWEAGIGFDGAWLAMPDSRLIAVARREFDKVFNGKPNQIDKKITEEITPEDITQVPPGENTEEGVRNDIRVFIQYLASWLTGSGAVAISDKMEDAATAEISRTKVKQLYDFGSAWYWKLYRKLGFKFPDHAYLTMSDGSKRVLTKELYDQMFEEELAHVRVKPTAKFDPSRLDEAAKYVYELTAQRRFEPFLTVRAYDKIVKLRTAVRMSIDELAKAGIHRLWAWSQTLEAEQLKMWERIARKHPELVNLEATPENLDALRSRLARSKITRTTWVKRTYYVGLASTVLATVLAVVIAVRGMVPKLELAGTALLGLFVALYAAGEISAPHFTRDLDAAISLIDDLKLPLPRSEVRMDAEMKAFQKEVRETEEWFRSPRFKEIKRLHSPLHVVRQRGNLRKEYPVATDAAIKLYDLLRNLFKKSEQATTYGPYTTTEVRIMKQLGIQVIYLGGWATSAKGSKDEFFGADIAGYAQNRVPDEGEELVRALLKEDEIQKAERLKMPEVERRKTQPIDYSPLIIADADTGHGNVQHIQNLTRRFVEVGIPSAHIEDQFEIKVCGHQGCKGVVSTARWIKRGNAMRFQYDKMRVPGLVVMRTDANEATFIESVEDGRDHRFVLGATTKDIAPYAHVVLAVIKRFYDRGVKELAGHQMYGLSDEDYKRADQWLASKNLMDVVDREISNAQKALKSRKEVEPEKYLDRAMTAVDQAWAKAAGRKTYVQAVADAMEARIKNGEGFQMSINEWKAFAGKVSNEEARKKAGELGIQIFWDWDLPRSPEGYYQITGGMEMSIARGRAAAPFADILWRESKTPDLDEAKEWADGVHAAYHDKMLAYNLSPSFNWDAFGFTDDEIRTFTGKLGKMGYVFNFITYGGHQGVALAAEELARGVVKEGALALARVQRRLRLVGSKAQRPQEFVGGPLTDDALLAATGYSASTRAMGGESTAKQHQMQIEPPPRLLEEWLSVWAKLREVNEVPLKVELLPAAVGSEEIMLNVFDPGEDKIADILFRFHRDRHGKRILSVTDQNTADRFRHRRLMTLMHLFLIHRYRADEVHYISPNEDNRVLAKAMMKYGIFEQAPVEGHIKVLALTVNSDRVARIVKADRAYRALKKFLVQPAAGAKSRSELRAEDDRSQKIAEAFARAVEKEVDRRVREAHERGQLDRTAGRPTEAEQDLGWDREAIEVDVIKKMTRLLGDDARKLQESLKQKGRRSEVRSENENQSLATRLFRSGMATRTASFNALTSNSTAVNRSSTADRRSGIGETTSATVRNSLRKSSTKAPTSRAVNLSSSMAGGTVPQAGRFVNIKNSENILPELSLKNGQVSGRSEVRKERVGSSKLEVRRKFIPSNVQPLTSNSGEARSRSEVRGSREELAATLKRQEKDLRATLESQRKELAANLARQQEVGRNLISIIDFTQSFLDNKPEVKFSTEQGSTTYSFTQEGKLFWLMSYPNGKLVVLIREEKTGLSEFSAALSHKGLKSPLFYSFVSPSPEEQERFSELFRLLNKAILIQFPVTPETPVRFTGEELTIGELGGIGERRLFETRSVSQLAEVLNFNFGLNAEPIDRDQISIERVIFHFSNTTGITAAIHDALISRSDSFARSEVRMREERSAFSVPRTALRTPVAERGTPYGIQRSEVRKSVALVPSLRGAPAVLLRKAKQQGRRSNLRPEIAPASVGTPLRNDERAVASARSEVRTEKFEELRNKQLREVGIDLPDTRLEHLKRNHQIETVGQLGDFLGQPHVRSSSKATPLLEALIKIIRVPDIQVDSDKVSAPIAEALQQALVGQEWIFPNWMTQRETRAFLVALAPIVPGVISIRLTGLSEKLGSHLREEASVETLLELKAFYQSPRFNEIVPVREDQVRIPETLKAFNLLVQSNIQPLTSNSGKARSEVRVKEQRTASSARLAEKLVDRFSKMSEKDREAFFASLKSLDAEFLPPKMIAVYEYDPSKRGISSLTDEDGEYIVTFTFGADVTRRTLENHWEPFTHGSNPARNRKNQKNLENLLNQYFKPKVAQTGGALVIRSEVRLEKQPLAVSKQEVRAKGTLKERLAAPERHLSRLKERIQRINVAPVLPFSFARARDIARQVELSASDTAVDQRSEVRRISPAEVAEPVQRAGPPLIANGREEGRQTEATIGKSGISESVLQSVRITKGIFSFEVARLIGAAIINHVLYEIWPKRYPIEEKSAMDSFAYFSNKEKAVTAPVLIALFLESVSSFDDATRQVLIDFLSHNIFAKIQITIPHAAKLELRALERHMVLQVLGERARRGLVSRGVNLTLTGDQSQVSRFLDINKQARALVYASDRNVLKSLEMKKRSDTLLVEDNVPLSQRSYALLGSIKTVIELPIITQAIQTASAILQLIENLGIAEKAKTVVLKAA